MYNQKHARCQDYVRDDDVSETNGRAAWEFHGGSINGGTISGIGANTGAETCQDGLKVRTSHQKRTLPTFMSMYLKYLVK